LGLDQFSGLQPAVLQHHKHNPTRQARPPTHLPFAAHTHSHSLPSRSKVSPPTHYYALCCLLLSRSLLFILFRCQSSSIWSFGSTTQSQQEASHWSYWSIGPIELSSPFSASVPILAFPPRSLRAVSCYLVLHPQRLQSWPLQPISSSAHLLLQSSALRKHTQIPGTVPSQGRYHRQVSFYRDQHHRLSSTKTYSGPASLFRRRSIIYPHIKIHNINIHIHINILRHSLPRQGGFFFTFNQVTFIFVPARALSGAFFFCFVLSGLGYLSELYTFGT